MCDHADFQDADCPEELDARPEAQQPPPPEPEPCCAVCLSELDSGADTCWLLGCDHRYHSACIGEWLSHRETCPLCRARATTAGVILDDEDLRKFVFTAVIKGDDAALRLLLAHGADAHQGAYVRTPLYMAAKNGHVAALKMLLAHGADADRAAAYAGEMYQGEDTYADTYAGEMYLLHRLHAMGRPPAPTGAKAAGGRQGQGSNPHRFPIPRESWILSKEQLDKSPSARDGMEQARRQPPPSRLRLRPFSNSS